MGITDVGLNTIGITLVHPSFVDIDNDGDFDLFVGGRDGISAYLNYFENVGTNINPNFAPVQTNPFGFVDSTTVPIAEFVDIDNDGDKDLFTGKFNGDIKYYENIGSITSPAFAGGLINPFGLVSVGNHSTPAFVDIDKDGDFDLFSGEYQGSIKFFENTGSNSAPAFGSLQTNPYGLSSISGFTPATTFADIDNDGDKDLFVGIHFGNTIYFENTTPNSISRINNTFNSHVYPNPVASSVALHYEIKNTTEEIILSIHTITGIKLITYPLNSHENLFKFSTKELPNGTYFYSIKSTKETLSVGKIVVLK